MQSTTSVAYNAMTGLVRMCVEVVEIGRASLAALFAWQVSTGAFGEMCGVLFQ